MSMFRPNAARQAGALLLLLTLPLAAQVSMQAPADDPSALPSEIMPRASKSLLLDVVRTPAGFFAVGERGHVISSSDGKQWTQVETPTRSALTSIAAVDDKLWAAGHDGVILHSADGGKTWVAQRRDPFMRSPDENPADHDPRQGVPILDILFTDASNGIAIGAYSLMLATSDGGTTWTPKQALAPAAPSDEPAAPMEGDIFSAEDLMLDEESDPHLNAITSTGPGGLVIVGERGTVLRSEDGGQNWRKLGFPYKGSMFGVLSLGNGRLLTYGLRGNVYESTDNGASWNKVPAEGSTSLMGGAALEGGGAVLAGGNGTLLSRASADAPFTVSTFKNSIGESPTLSGVVSDGNGGYVLVGDKGVDQAQLQ
jgi:photosystem II stability/assembly factor-like uncharacterized protein